MSDEATVSSTPAATADGQSSHRDEEPITMPAFVRRAILAQGRYDPDAIEAAAQTVDLEAAELAEQKRLEEASRATAAKRQDEDGRSRERKWYDDL